MRLGRSQGGLSMKLHQRAEGSGKPMTAVLTVDEVTPVHGSGAA
jgi:hypothetical protein